MRTLLRAAEEGTKKKPGKRKLHNDCLMKNRSRNKKNKQNKKNTNIETKKNMQS